MDVEKKAEEIYKEFFIRTLQEKDSSFSMLGVRCNSKDSIGKRKMNAGQLYLLLDGYEIKDGEVTKALWRENQDKLYDDYYSESLEGKPHIQVSAIVGPGLLSPSPLLPPTTTTTVFISLLQCPTRSKG